MSNCFSPPLDPVTNFIIIGSVLIIIKSLNKKIYVRSVSMWLKFDVKQPDYIKYEREDKSSVIITLSKDFEEKFMGYFHPNVGVCYRQNLIVDTMLIPTILH